MLSDYHISPCFFKIKWLSSLVYKYKPKLDTWNETFFKKITTGILNFFQMAGIPNMEMKMIKIRILLHLFVQTIKTIKKCMYTTFYHKKYTVDVFFIWV